MSTYWPQRVIDGVVATIAGVFFFYAGYMYERSRATPCESKMVLTIPGEGYQVVLPEKMSKSQEQLLDLAYQTAVADKLPHPQLLQGILLQETLAGGLASYRVAGQEAGLRPNQRYYGIYQIKLDAARDVLKKFPELWSQFDFQTKMDEEVIAQLMLNDAFSTAVASKYLKILYASGYRTAGALAVAYNKGPGGAMGVTVSADPYAVGVSRHMQKLAPVDPAVYHVQPGDSLNKIAITFHKDWHEIFAQNPSAFVNGNPNVLMASVDIRFPQ